ncbi:hypothetical protein RRG08_023490 [Elysia crispata]|uniref:Uncharacterized protein n=1 Tax=Elysia crispata TaxID=231223 RepID=A0AAE0Z011_9GAST|nr:hypothetical protein RRG08_023490 [Elysia crispata]
MIQHDGRGKSTLSPRTLCMICYSVVNLSQLAPPPRPAPVTVIGFSGEDERFEGSNLFNVISERGPYRPASAASFLSSLNEYETRIITAQHDISPVETCGDEKVLIVVMITRVAR